MLKRTPLFEAHQALGARLIEFGGWEMPVQYTGIADEHQAVRTAAGVFDISHMGEIVVSGPGAQAFLNWVATNDARKLAIGQGQYTLICNERGGVIDDLYAYRLRDTEYLLIVNASRIDTDLGWLQDRHRSFSRHESVQLRNASDDLGALAIQGPAVAAFIDRCIPGARQGGTPVEHASQLKKNEIAEFGWNGTSLWLARTGYTGEDGFEVVASAAALRSLWDRVLQEGRPYGLKPCGLGARDTLRTEVCYPLYGHELDENTSPLEAGLGFFVSFEKGEFVGRAVLVEHKAGGLRKKCVALKMAEKSPPPRPGYPIWSKPPSEAKLGEVVSGTQSPTLGVGIGMGYVPPEFAKAGSAIDVEIRGRRFPAVIVPKPFYKKAV